MHWLDDLTDVSSNRFATHVCLALFASLLQADEYTIEAVTPSIQAVTFSSRILQEQRTFCVVIPEQAKAAPAEWPVLLMLHGRGRNRRSLIDDRQTREALITASVITVLPDGDDGWYINSPARQQDRYNDYLEEVLKTASVSCGLNRRREAWGISGWSMGGYGCVMFAQSHPDKFAAVAPMIGLLDFPRDDLLKGQDYKIPTDRFGSDRVVWNRLNPISRVERLRGQSILVITADQAFDRTMNEHFHARLTESMIPHRYLQLSGGHTFETVRRALPRVLEFMTAALEMPKR